MFGHSGFKLWRSRNSFNVGATRSQSPSHSNITLLSGELAGGGGALVGGVLGAGVLGAGVLVGAGVGVGGGGGGGSSVAPATGLVFW